MATSTDSDAASAPPFVCLPWDVGNPLVQVDHTETPTPSVQVRHLAYPYTCVWTTSDPDIAGLLPIAHRYLEKVNAKLELQREHLLALQPPGHPPPPGFKLAWLYAPGDNGCSQWIERGGANGDRTALLLANLHLTYSGFPLPDWRFLQGGQGLRILAQVTPVVRGRVTVRITGVVSTVPTFPQNYLLSEPELRQFQGELMSMAQAAEAGLPEDVDLVDHGFTFLIDLAGGTPRASGTLFQAKTSMPPASGTHTVGAVRDSMQLSATSYKLTQRFQSPAGFDGARLHPLITFAAVPAHARVLASDPISQTGTTSVRQHRPHKPSNAFGPLRSRQSLGNLPEANPGIVALESAYVRVRHVRLVDPPQLESTPKVVPADCDAPARSNTFAAVSAFFHVQSMFQRMLDQKLDIAAYFRFADLPLDVHYRAGIVPAFGDGRTVNAQVRWMIESDAQATTRRLELRFALGDQHMATGRLPANMLSASERHPLGVATDVRWCWHEFGHVLNAAATGELELPFAHSVGDALAAIVCDPGSKLACRPDGAADNTGAWRHVTFPWVFIPRRHDRDVQRGWSWSETVCGVPPPHGYRSEQLLSTTLFRLYRALGGDNVQTIGGLRVPADTHRAQAAQYTTYLIMRTLSSLGPAHVSPCVSVHQFVHAMRTVDAFTANIPGPGGYIGGSANKVIQWAFEQQGLYGMPQPGSAVMGPDAHGPGAPRVDLHVEDRRLQTSGPYTPVDLLGEDWHAATGVIDVKPLLPGASVQRVTVRIDNRGASPATGTRIRLWTAACAAGSAIPQFPGAAWKRLWVLQGARTVPGNNGATPGQWRSWPVFWLPPGPGRYLMLLEASCAADRSNIDLETGLPCATLPGPTERLVAFDNNLGLRAVEI